jgi:hypothetical protein
VLLPVVLALALVATLAFLLSRESAMGVHLAADEAGGDEAGYAVQAGLARARWLVDQSGCTGYPNLAGVPFGRGTYDVAVSPTEGSPVTLTATATLPDGTKRTLQRAGVRAYNGYVTLVLQPGPEGKDSYVEKKLSDKNNGALDFIDTEYSSSSDFALIEFDLGTLPVGAHILEARLGLYAYSGNVGPGAAVTLYRLTQPWTETGVTYQVSDGSTPWTWPANYDAVHPASQAALSSGAGWFEWDVSALVASWHRGDLPNRGMALIPNSAVYYKAFYSGEATLDPTLRPKLTVTYACECGVTCDGTSLAVLLVVPNPASLSAQDSAKKSLMASWGHTVTPISASASQADFDAAVGDSDVAYVSEEVLSTELGTKLRGAPIGVVNEESALYDDFGLAEYPSTPSPTTALNITDNTHYITEPFALGWLTILSWSEDVVAMDGTLAGGLRVLGDFDGAGGPPALAVVDMGGALYGGGTAAGRRAKLPWGGSDFDINALTADGKTLMRRALEWAGGAGGGALVLNPVLDTWVDQANPGDSRGTEAQIKSGADAGWKRFRSLLRFDVSALPADATVTAATLRLYTLDKFGNTEGTMSVQRVTASWNEGSTWNSTGGGSFTAFSPAVATTPAWAAGTWVEWALPPGLIHEWRDGVGTPNHGLLVEYEGTKKNHHLSWASREHGTAEWRPQLVIEYTRH